MYLWQKLTMTQKYQLFILLIGVFPVVLFSLFYFENTFIKFNHHLSHVLQSGVMIVQDAIQDNHRHQVTSFQEATVESIGKEYKRFSKKQHHNLEKTIQAYQEANDFDITILLDHNKNIIFSTSHIKVFNPNSFNLKIQHSLTGSIEKGFERFYFGTDPEIHLAYVASTPIYTDSSRKNILAVLLTGHQVKKDASIHIISQVIPEPVIRFIVKTPEGFQVESVQTISPQKGQSSLHQISNKTRQALENIDLSKSKNPVLSASFSESIGKTDYLSRLIGFKNQQNELIGAIAMSVSKSPWLAFATENLTLYIIFVALILILVSLSGKWFERDFIYPMNHLTTGIKQLSKGDLKNRLPMLKTTNPEAKQTLQSFNNLVDKLEETETLRGTFISTLSHDLKTPLIAQKKVAHIFLDEFKGYSNPSLYKLSVSLINNIDDTLDMINKLIDTYRFEDGRVSLNLHHISLPDLVKAVFSGLESLSIDAKINLNMKVDPPTQSIKADPIQLKRVLHNLILNALQNSPANSTILVSLSYKNNHVHMDVKDNGNGIASEDLPHIFNRYYIGNKTQKRIGSGLGLYICKMIIELHNGTISVTSKIGQGTCFSVDLPICPTTGGFTHGNKQHTEA